MDDCLDDHEARLAEAEEVGEERASPFFYIATTE